ncbi:MAG: hypothetical protein GX868_16050, partial [Actinobacteria bacterium]|nr:hypothetical protein [Actinomycetota bacterium]
MAAQSTSGVAGRLFRGYGPLIGFAAIFTAMAVFVPSVGQEVIQEVATADTASALDDTGTAAVLTETTIVDEVAGTETTIAADAAAPGAAGGPPSGPNSTGGSKGPAGGGGNKAPGGSGAPGAAAGGIQGCGDFQVKADPYSPPCLKFSGANGGATSQGVTEKEIVIAVRIQAFSSGLVDAVSKAAGADLPSEDEADVRRTIEGLVEFFNRTYEFYGRKLRLEIFNGRGDVLKEVLGGGQEGAQNDALKVAQEIKAFADISAITPPYIDALASRKVIAIGAPYLSRAWMKAREPYVWSQFIDCSSVAENSASYYLSRFAGKPAVNAGGGLNGQPRRVGIVVPNSSWYQDCLQDGVNQLKQGGV